MINQYLNPLTSLINSYLHLDATSSERLRALQHKKMQLQILPFNLNLQCTFSVRGIHLSVIADEIANSDPNYNVCLSATPLQLLALCLNKKDRQLAFQKDIHLSGDAEVAQQLMQLFADLNIDWEEQLSKIFGDISVYHGFNFMKTIKKDFLKITNHLTEDIKDYLTEEKKCVPTPDELHHFYDAIDHLRMDVDRLEANLMYLRETINSREKE